jgi:polar amino acid transport system permease protein
MPRDLGFKVIFQGNNLERLAGGLGLVAYIAFISAALSVVLGVFVGIAMTSKNRLVRGIFRIYFEIIRIIPQLVLLFIFYFGLSSNLGLNMSGVTAAIVVFTIWGAAEMGDLVRGAITSIPKQQYESAEAIGLAKLDTYRFIIIPQAVKRLLPGAINLVTRMIKTTALVELIGVVEMVKVGQQIIEANLFRSPSAPFWVYLVIFFLYFIICWPISLAARALEKHWRD